MPGGAIGPNVHMMQEAGILDKYSDVLAEFPVVVKAGGAWTSVTPGSQQYWLQAFNNVLYGRWKKIDAGWGKSVLGYFGKTPLPPDPEVKKIAAKLLKLDPFDGDPLEAAPDSLGPARKALQERDIETTDENVFLVASAIVPGKKMELNEGIRFLTGKAKIVLPFKKKEEPKPAAKPAAAPAPAPAAAAAPTAMELPKGPVTTTCKVVEGDTTRRFKVTIELPGGVAVPLGAAVGAPAMAAAPAPAAAPVNGGGTPVFSPFDGKAELVDIKVKVGDVVSEGDVVAEVEAMKAKHDVRSPSSGRVESIDADLGDDVMAGKAIMTIGG